MRLIKRLKQALATRGRAPRRPARPLTGGKSERELVEDLRKARITALCMGPILTLAGLILAAVTLSARPVREWSSTGAILMLVICACWTGAGIAMIVWACRWTPEAWAQLVIKRMNRKAGRNDGTRRR